MPDEEKNALRQRVEAVTSAVAEQASGGISYPHDTDVFWTWRTAASR